jgi:hypothetical protein
MNEYLNAIRDLINLLKSKGRTGQYLRWNIMPDESNDATLVSYRAYGSREYANVVMIAAGTNSIADILPNEVIIMPTLMQIRQIQSLYPSLF